ncbi:MAG: hypothetical protein QT05_C0050G0027 [archaeon GW2011_AR13]|nr:MAG: hypothetical protein QT05_C0050G0027 [archaeon GW2011_AR13]HIG95124.1 YhbY family RNA-binding protein [Nanoarchaeota archaeon]HIH63206.1 YhbY family RNA-binding protein [Nanoarchaeota archaeon]HIJ09310.1 YhbY family RNA-binding protein [Nanoarchaeota archaeon]HLD55543.1 YhbY family RNA-binding protein [Candidatus Nanoarchaeia archaeon]
MVAIRNIQLGKLGVTDNFIESLKNQFKTCKNVKISVLPSARDGKDSVKKYSTEILEKLGKNYYARVIGFTIALKRLRRP